MSVSQCETGHPIDAERRRLLQLSAFGVLFSLGVPPARSFAAAPASPGAEIAEIAPGVFVHRGEHGAYTRENRGDISNCGFVVGRDAVAVIDTGGTAAVGRDLLAAIRTRTDRPVRYVVNTHMHPDHVLGNAAFRGDGVSFIGHQKLAAALSARAERYLTYNREAAGEAAFAGTEIVLPDTPVVDTLDVDLGGRRLQLRAHPTAHTDNDLTVRDIVTDTVFMGDLIFAGHVPTIDGSIRGWMALLEDLVAQPAARIVPGHGPAAMPWPAAAEPLRRYLEAVATDVRAAIRAGRGIRETMSSAAAAERSQWELFDDYHARNIAASFAELEWE
ncbi:MAG: quinoprotein relay system zinc metallohydrolase 2 [Hyphomicrobiaceae bacterium]